jgi:transcriptional regulator with XRE-family HTH domain
MDFYRQISGARGVLGWSRKDLSQASGVSERAIEELEKGHANIKESTRRALVNAFLVEGIEFTPHGIEQRELSSYVLGSYMDVLFDIEKTLQGKGEVLKHCVDDRRSSPEVIEKVRQMRESGIKERLTIADDNDFIAGNPEDYRQIPKAYFASSEVMLVYADKVAFFVEGNILVMCSVYLSRVFKDQFEYWWNIGKRIDGA